MAYLMQATSSTTGVLYTWETSTPDWAGSAFPGPGTAQNVAIATQTVSGGANTIFDHDATGSPIAHWVFNETLNDTGGGGLHLTATSGSALYTDIFPGKRALQLTTAAIMSQASAGTILQLAGDMSMSMLLSMSDLTANRFVVSYGGGDSAQANNVLYSFGIDSTTAGAPRYQHRHGAGLSTGSIYTPSPANFVMPVGLCHFSFTRASNVVQFYLNGRTFAPPSSTLTAADGGTTSKFHIGNEAGSFSSSCILRSMVVFNYALSAAQVKAQYNLTLGPAFGLAA